VFGGVAYVFCPEATEEGAGPSRELGSQLIAFFTSAPIFFSSAAVNSFSAKAVGHMAPSSRFASSVKPNVRQEKSAQLD
jgi:hypothetical protein